MQLICRGQTKFFSPSPKIRQRRRKFGSCFGAQRTAPAPLPNHGFKGRRQSFRSTVNLWEMFCKADMFATNTELCYPPPPTKPPVPSMRVSIHACSSAWVCVSLSTYAEVRGFVCLMMIWWWLTWCVSRVAWRPAPQKCKEVAVLPRRNMNRRPSIYKPWFYDS